MTAFPKKNILVHRLTYPLTVSSLFRRPPVVSPVFPPDWTVPVSRFSPLFNFTIFTFLSPRSPTPFLSFHFHSTSICKKNQFCNSFPFFTLWLKFLSHYFFTFCSPVASLFLTISSSTVFVYCFSAAMYFNCFSAAMFFLLFFSRAIFSLFFSRAIFSTVFQPRCCLSFGPGWHLSHPWCCCSETTLKQQRDDDFDEEADFNPRLAIRSWFGF